MSYHKIRFGIPSPVNKLNTEIKQFTSVLVCRIVVRKTKKINFFLSDCCVMHLQQATLLPKGECTEVIAFIFPSIYLPYQ